MPETERLCLRCTKGIPKWKSKNENFCTGVCRLKFREEQRHTKAAKRAFEAKSYGLIRVHSCLANLLDPYLEGCRCRLMVSEERAKELIAQGEAVDFAARKAIFTSGPVLLTGLKKKTTRVETIERPHCERAEYSPKQIQELRTVTEADWAERAKEERLRIEIYGLLTLFARVQIGKKFVPLRYEPEGGRENDWGHPVMWSFKDERTEGGKGKDVSGSPRDNDLEDEPLEGDGVQPESQSDSDFAEPGVEPVSLEDMVPEEECEEVLVED